MMNVQHSGSSQLCQELRKKKYLFFNLLTFFNKKYMLIQNIITYEILIKQIRGTVIRSKDQLDLQSQNINFVFFTEA